MRLGDNELIRVFAKHEPYNNGHLGEVVTEMKKMGTPRITVVEWRGDYFAIEGSHRLAAAHYLELVPDLNIIEPDYISPQDESFWEQVKKTLPHYSWLKNNKKERNLTK